MRAWVTGGTGFVGSNVVAELLAAGVAVHGTIHRTPPTEAACTWSAVDLADAPAVRSDVAEAAPDVVVHCAIRNDLVSLSTDRRGAWADFVDATRNVVDAANASGAQVILVSTDWVFDGTQGPADETEPPRPINSYGLLKFAQERVVAERAHRGAIARVSGVNGRHRACGSLPRAQDVGFGYLVTALVEALRARQPFTVWVAQDINMVATPSLASESARMILRIAQLGATGVFHCCGGQAVTRRGLAGLACEVFDLDEELLRFGPPDPDALPAEMVPYDTSLDARATAAALGVELPDARRLLSLLRAQWSPAPTGGTP
ncbi:MAG: sugar nucleotide-binding protein [Euzebyales bacterium]|nr:sugar nucleotide-binding protein [Euzebyales bacterium]